jgi:hypothetical protein
VVRVIGRWSSDAFTIYLRKHSAILAPYLQASSVMEPFVQYTSMPSRLR